MRTVFMALGAVVTLACNAPVDGSDLTEARAQPVNRHLDEYVREFVRLYAEPVAALPIFISHLENGVAGKCYIPGAKPAEDQLADAVFGESTRAERRIVISSRFYEKNKDNRLAMQNVIFHELGHCVLARGHTTATVSTREFGDIPLSIMFPSAFGQKPFYLAHWQRYIDELFARGDYAPKESAPRLAKLDEDLRDCVSYDEPPPPVEP